MAKRKESAVAAAAKRDVKKHKPVSKEKTTRGTTKAKKDTGNRVEEEEEKIVRKVWAKPRSSSKSASASTPSTTSKYFQSPPKKEARSHDHDDDGNDDDFRMVTTATPILPTDVTGPSRPKKEDSGEEDESDEDDWEEVEELSGPLGPAPPLPTQPVEIEIETPDLIRRRQKKEKRKAEFELYLKRMVNRFNKDVLEDTHKVHLMCLIANGMFRNRLCSEPDLLAITLSLLPNHFTMVAKDRIDYHYLCGLLKWFGATFTLNPSLPYEDLPDPRALLERRLGSLSARDHQEMTHLFLLVLRSLHLFCRLVLSLQPISFKPPRAKSKGSEGSGGVAPGKSPGCGKPPKESSLEPKVSPGTKRPALASPAAAGRGQRPKNAKRRSVASKVSYKEETGSEEEEVSDEAEEEFQATRDEEDSEDDEEESSGAKRGKRRSQGKRKHSSGDSSSAWLCVDVEHGVGRPQLCWQNATAPVTYVVAVDANGRLKDLGRKYDPAWMTTSRKRRLQAKMLDRPLPTSIAELKNHPLYALTRHLLKYEALYPPTAAVLGYCRGEPVYSRDCIHQMHSKDTWLKEARTVRLGEEPFKMVKGFSNRSRKARMMVEQKEEKDLALFGEWQTEEYQPPIAVPRNEYGNVYLFKPCMLPVGCVHLRLPTLNRVARKLDLDAAPAVTGLTATLCKREKRAASNWKLLVKGLVIRERLQQRYGKKSQGLGGAGGSSQGGEGAEGLSADEEEGPEAKTAAETLAMSWPQNRQDEEEEEEGGGKKKRKITKREQKGQEKGQFPFEKV
ncbi:hypothetical protein NHX12_013369 [Muraenolepis orangiensis]|uniref:Xeroderma pigmentosum, complementation group C n=1 Tax=Muraenolepis orangiensis TaxID=630683 RepID=A0A9Q0I6U2_9TELE|nr:hypothetical protein NHX12_013369 [Muraenolepis orangiensis]